MGEKKVQDKEIMEFIEKFNDIANAFISVVAVRKTKPEDWFDLKNAELVSMPIPPVIKEHFELIAGLAIESKIFDSSIRSLIETSFFTHMVAYGITAFSKDLEIHKATALDMAKKMIDSLQEMSEAKESVTNKVK